MCKECGKPLTDTGPRCRDCAGPMVPRRADVAKAMSQLDGTTTAAVSLMTGLSADELIALGGFDE